LGLVNRHIFQEGLVHLLLDYVAAHDGHSAFGSDTDAVFAARQD
jgi:hypothetical protein